MIAIELVEKAKDVLHLAPWMAIDFLNQAIAELEKQENRIRKMYAGDLSLESRLNGYKVVVGELQKRITKQAAELEKQPKCKTCGGSRRVPETYDDYADWRRGIKKEDEDMNFGPINRTTRQKKELYEMYVEHNKNKTKPCPDCKPEPTSDALKRRPK